MKLDSTTILVERNEFAHARQRLLDTGAAIAFGTDYPVEPIMSAKVDYTIEGGKVVYKREGAK